MGTIMTGPEFGVKEIGIIRDNFPRQTGKSKGLDDLNIDCAGSQWPQFLRRYFPSITSLRKRDHRDEQDVI